MADSIKILETVKRTLSVEVEDEDFDFEILVFINSYFGNLHQLGVGPKIPFTADKSSTWDQFTTDKTLASVQTYMYTSVRLVFDPPPTGPLNDALKAIKNEQEWRLKEAADPRLKEVIERR